MSYSTENTLLNQENSIEERRQSLLTLSVCYRKIAKKDYDFSKAERDQVLDLISFLEKLVEN